MDVGHILSSSPPIAENIFRHLSARDLSNCAKVCSLWHRLAVSERERRNKINWFFEAMRCDFHDTVHSSCRECSLYVNQETDLSKGLSKQLNSIRVHPHFCIAFSSCYLVDHFGKYFPSFDYPPVRQRKRIRHVDNCRKRAYLKAAVDNALTPHLPSQCKVAFCVAPGIIGCLDNSSPLEIEEGTALTGFLLPQVPGMEIHHFAVDGQKCELSDLVPENTHVKCLLAFLTQRGSSITNKLVQSCLLKENCKVAIGGAVVDRTESLLGSVIAFCGPNVEAASVVIKPNEEKDELETKLKGFQDSGLLENRCFAFMFACVARGFYLYREYNTESSTFHRMYPHVPLIGIFGNGEIGVNYMPHLPTENKVIRIGKLARCTKKYFHSYTTVFVLISVKM